MIQLSSIFKPLLYKLSHDLYERTGDAKFLKKIIIFCLNVIEFPVEIYFELKSTKFKVQWSTLFPYRATSFRAMPISTSTQFAYHSGSARPSLADPRRNHPRPPIMVTERFNERYPNCGIRPLLSSPAGRHKVGVFIGTWSGGGTRTSWQPGHIMFTKFMGLQDGHLRVRLLVMKYRGYEIKGTTSRKPIPMATKWLHCCGGKKLD